GASLVDIEQVVVLGQLTLCLVVEVVAAGGAADTVLKELLFAARALGLNLDFKALDPTQAEPEQRPNLARYAVTAIGSQLDAAGLHELSRVLAEHSTNISSIRRLSQNGLSSLEILCSLPADVNRERTLRAALLAATAAPHLRLARPRERAPRGPHAPLRV